ncbi:ester cyclase [Natrarchaeobius sp. A-rgal3]|uniref:ester cyclase n=1 Tax=Natrarchaeobius versutus TaxID=1679078 RepID=UPI00350F9F3D
MPTDESMAVVRRDIETVWNEADLEAIADLVTEDFVYYNPMVTEDVEGPEGYRWLVENFRGAMSDFEMETESMVADDTTVATRFRTTGTHDGELLGVEPTGAEISVTGMMFDRIEDGRLSERYVNDDALGFMRQLGLVDQGSF